MGLLVAFGNLLQIIPSAYLNGSLNVALNQSVIVTNIILSFLFLSRRYNALHIGGVILVLLGIGLDLTPVFLSSPSSGSDNWVIQSLWALMIILSNVVFGFCNIYTEKVLQGQEVDVWYWQCWIMFFTLVFGLLTLPFAFVPFPPPYNTLSIPEFGNYLASGFKCLAGINSMRGDKCQGTAIVMAIYMAFNFTFNMSALFVFKYGSSSLAMVAAAMRLVFSSIAFMIP